MKTFRQILTESDKTDKIVNKYLNFIAPRATGTSDSSLKGIIDLVKTDNKKAKDTKFELTNQEIESVIKELTRIYTIYLKRKIKTFPKNWARDKVEKDMLNMMDLTTHGIKKITDKYNKMYSK